ASTDPRWIFPLLIANLIAEMGIVVTGGLVRLTKSGLGCSTWPQCTPGSFVPTATQPEGFHKYIEFGNRTLTFVLSALAIAVVVAAYKHLRGRGYLTPAMVILLGVLAQAVVGGITVLTGLNPATVAFHFLASMVLVAAATLLVVRYVNENRPSSNFPRPVTILGRAIIAIYAVVLILGTIVTGSGPHSGDAATPARLNFDIRAVSWLHADFVTAFLGLVIGMLVAVYLCSPDHGPRRAWSAVLAVTILQGLLGYTQYLLAVPEGLVLAHMTLAAVLTASVTWAYLTLRPHPAATKTSATPPQVADVTK
ncbi:COX15/CtaA family protein, partial [Dermatophilus congolensis]